MINKFEEIQEIFTHPQVAYGECGHAFNVKEDMYHITFTVGNKKMDGFLSSKDVFTDQYGDLRCRPWVYRKAGDSVFGDIAVHDGWYKLKKKEAVFVAPDYKFV
jgi:hypothetical protein